MIAVHTLLAQSPSEMNPQPSSVVQLPLSGRASQTGSVSVTQSTTNTGGGNTVNVIDSSVSATAPFNGSVPQGQVNPNEIQLTLEDALSLGLRFNLGAISQAQAVLQAKGQRLVARSGLLPNVNAAVSEELEKLNLRTQGVESSTFPVTAEFNFFDARAARLNQTIFDLVKIENLHSASDTLRASLNSARNARDLIVLAVAGSYVQLIATQARISAAKAQVETSRTIYQQAADSGLMSTIFGTWLFFARYAFPLRSSSKSQLRVQRVLVSKSRSIGRMQRTDKAPFIEDTGILIDPWHGRGHRFDPDPVHRIKPTTYVGSILLPCFGVRGDHLCTKRAISFNAVSDPVITLLDGGEFHVMKQHRNHAEWT